MAFKRKQTGGESALAKAKSGFAPDPKELVLKELKVEEGVVVRFLSFHDDDTYFQPGRRVTTKNPNTGDLYEKQIVADPGPPHNEKIFDDSEDGMAIADGAEANTLFVPVMVLYTVDKDGVVAEEINELKYLRLGPGIAGSMKKLKENIKDDYGFEDIPDYNVRIEVVQKSPKSPKNYEPFPVQKIRIREGKKVVSEACPGWRVDDLQEALGEELWDLLNAEFDELVAHLKKVAEAETAVETVKRRFCRYRGASSNEDSGKGMKRNLPADEAEEEEEEAEEETKETGTRFRNLRGRK